MQDEIQKQKGSKNIKSILILYVAVQQHYFYFSYLCEWDMHLEAAIKQLGLNHFHTLQGRYRFYQTFEIIKNQKLRLSQLNLKSAIFVALFLQLNEDKGDSKTINNR